MSNDVIQLVDKLNEWVVDIQDRLNNTTEEIPPTIPPIDTNVPSIYGNWKCLEDFGDASFLPETKKWQFVAFMQRYCGLDVRSYLEDIQEKEDLVWSYYEGVDELFRAESNSSKSFIEHLLANSCFIIFAMVILTYDRKLRKILRESDENNDTKNQRIKEFKILKKCILHDDVGTQRHMLTMDYQIPWFVVDEAVYTNHSNLSNLFNTPIHKLALSCFKYIYPEMHKSKVNGGTGTHPPGGFKHLLHIFHWSRTPQRMYQKIDEILPKMDTFYIPSATELQLSATVFKEHTANGIDVSFDERRLSGVMELQPWYLSQYTNEIYKHLLAFERGYGMVCGFPVTTYVACIVCLLQTEADVRLLQDNGIFLRTRDGKGVLSSLQCFKSTVLSNDIPMSWDLLVLSGMVRRHHERRSSRSYAEFKSRYCANPWITISVIGASLIFVLTFIQTIYSTLSYYKQ